jgi:caffeoyl-CoA O-methyltransferase
MILSHDEPASPDAIREWIGHNAAERDLFAHVARQSEEHRIQHGCNSYPSGDGRMLGVLAAAVKANRILEIGTGLAYSALWLAHGSGPKALVETIERDTTHAHMAMQNIASEGFDGRIVVHVGEASSLVPDFKSTFDMVFLDADVVDYIAYLDQCRRLLRRGGTLVTSNIFYGQYDSARRCVHTGAEVRKALANDSVWYTSFLPNGDAVSVSK